MASEIDELRYRIRQLEATVEKLQDACTVISHIGTVNPTVAQVLGELLERENLIVSATTDWVRLQPVPGRR